MGGGAAIATFRLLRGLNKLEGVEAKLFCQHINVAHPDTIGPESKLDKVVSTYRPYLDRLRAIPYGTDMLQSYQFSPGWLPMRTKSLKNISKADVVHLNWVNNGFISISSLRKITAPIVWTLHDMWAMTGGCHYCGNCDQFVSSCGNCPCLNSSKKNDLSATQLQQKKQLWSTLPFIVVCPSKWLAKCAKESSVLKNKRIEVIPNGIDTNIFQPMDKLQARSALNLPHDKKLVLFNAFNALNDVRKGIDTCIKTMGLIAERGNVDIELAVLGEYQLDSISSHIPIHYLGKLSDEIALSLVYSAADIFFNPSKQDNLPNTILEAMACGLPCVASEIGGFPDLIKYGKNGFLSNSNDYQDFAQHIITLANDTALYSCLSESARKTILQSFDINHVSYQYYELYKDLTSNYVKPKN